LVGQKPPLSRRTRESSGLPVHGVFFVFIICNLHALAKGESILDEWITSVGIDLGTSTTKWLLSRLRLTLTSGGFALPRYEITERVIEYASPVFPTPLLGEDEIDVAAVAALLDAEYAAAGLRPESVRTGAVIVTGETATKRNAEELTRALARHAGQFVVATAGADLESLLAGKGSGALRRSLETDGVVANVDIGGGTANTAYFRDGRLIATATFHIGGRLVRLEQSGRVLYVAPALRAWASEPGVRLRLPEAGASATFAELRELCRSMADVLFRCVSGDPGALLAAGKLSVGDPASALPAPDEIRVSGGIGALMEEPPPETIGQTARHGDIGPLLAAELAAAARALPMPVQPAPAAARATVIGAGTQTTEIGGATMYCSPGVLPLRDVPVVVWDVPAEALDGAEDARRLRESALAAVRGGVAAFAGAGGDPPFALCLRAAGYCSYRRLQRLTDALAAAYAAEPLRAAVPLFVCESDMAKALGYMLLAKLEETQRARLVCLDQLSPREGDYIDVGEPIKEEVVPVVVKSLVFGG